ncbi:MAG: hypothetical protein EA442_04115 [Candidatus Nitrosopelagicus sp.]|nr:MAG: hypothetical protein EA442_04115 [Candidatus Nitrosopelagicus sp.]
MLVKLVFIKKFSNRHAYSNQCRIINVNKAITIGIIIAIAIGVVFVSTQTNNDPEIIGDDEPVKEVPKQYSINLNESLNVASNP